MARHGENIRQRIDGRWEGRYQVFDESRGKSVYRSVYGRDYRQAKDKLSMARLGLLRPAAEKLPAAEAQRDGQEEVEESGAEESGAILFSQAAGKWLAQVSSRRKYSTYIKYASVYRIHLAGAVGSLRVSPGTVQELGEKIFDHLSGAGLSESLQKSVICVANQILAFAGRDSKAQIPQLKRPPAKEKKKTAVAFSRAEQAQLLERVDGRAEPFPVAVLLCLYAGLRIGELCALRWTDIDVEDRMLTVSRTVQRIAAAGHRTKTILWEGDPKSESSRRGIPLAPECLEILSRLGREGQYVFGGKKPLDPRTMQYRFRKLLKEAGIEGGTFHTLRHTFATNCVENGMDVKALSELLGHSDVKITLNRYVHPTMDSKRQQIGALSGFYGRIRGRAA